jgi:protein O-mannosyl-transferase
MKACHSTHKLPDATSRPSWGAVIAITFLTVLPWLLYGHTLRFGTVLDDDAYVFENPYLKDASSFLYALDFQSFMQRCIQWGVSADIALNFITRPVTYFTFYLNRLISGDATSTYRLVNIAIHMGNGLLLFTLIRRLLRRDSISLLAAATAALLFIVHPLATESVTYITQRFESLATFFCLLALILYLKAHEATSPRERWMLGTASVLATLFSMLSKETGVVTPILLVLLNLLHLQDRPWAALRRAAAHLALLPLIPSLIAITHWVQTSGKLTAFTLVNITNKGNDPYPLSDYLLTQVCAWISYLRLIILPIGQNFDHAYPLVTSPLDFRFIAALLITTGLIAGAWINYRRHSGRSAALILLGVLWYFGSLLPSSSIVPLPDLFSEHRSYLPSVGFFLALAAGLRLLLKLASRMKEASGVLHTVGALVIVVLCVSTLLRNEALRNRESLWTDALAKGSNTARVWKGLGIVHFNSGRIEDSARSFEKALEVSPEDEEAWLNLCTLHIKTEQPDKALEVSERALQLRPHAIQLLHLRGIALVMGGRMKEGLQQWHMILQSFPDYRAAHLSMAEVLAQNGHEERALHHLQLAERSGLLPPAFVSIKKKLQSHLSVMR